jgi:hypothetical protein
MVASAYPASFFVWGPTCGSGDNSYGIPLLCCPSALCHCVRLLGEPKKKQLCGKKSALVTGLILVRCGSRERKGFMVTVWCTGLEQQEYEVVGQLPGCWMVCFRKLSDES